MKLEVKKRDNKYVKNANDIMGVVYGGDIKENILIVGNRNKFENIYKEVGSSGILELDVDGKSYDVIIKDIQLDNISGEYYHIDFYAITKGQEMEASVSFEFVGESSAAKKGGMLNTSLTEVLIKAMPKDLPNHIVVDLERLVEIGDSIRLADLELPSGVSFADDNVDLETAIVSVIAAKSVADEEEANAGEVEMTPEVENETEVEEKTEEKTE